MDNQLTIFDEIQNKSLAPWLPENNPDEKYAPMLSELKQSVSDFIPKYTIDFYRPFNYKTKYYMRLLLCEMNAYSERVIKLITDAEDLRMKKYLLNDTLDKKLKTRLKSIGVLIREHQYDLSLINPKNSSFDVDTNHKTETFIMQLLKTVYIAMYLEIQSAFSALRVDPLIIDDFYAQLLFEPQPYQTFIREASPVVEIKTDKNAKPLLTPKDVASFSFTYKQMSKNSDKLTDLCCSLKKSGFIDRDSSVADFKRIFTGKEITKPVRWTGNPSDLYYFIQLIYTRHHLVEELRQKQWMVTCKCFVQADGSPFDRAKLKDLKKPHLTSLLLEKAVELIK